MVVHRGKTTKKIHRYIVILNQSNTQATAQHTVNEKRKKKEKKL